MAARFCAGEFPEPVKSNAPVLIVSGELRSGNTAGPGRRNRAQSSQQPPPDHSQRNAHELDCVERVVADFIDRGSTAGLDVSCLEQIRACRLLHLRSRRLFLQHAPVRVS